MTNSLKSAKLGKVFRDPVHDLIHLDREDKYILDLIDTKEFQRLRRIRQLGVGHLTYPGAEHTRFVHSLGVFNFARRMIERLRARHHQESEICEILKDKASVIKAAALVHDIGHGPLSHVWERVFDERTDVDHEEWSCNILKDESTEVYQRLRDAAIDVNDVLALISDVPPRDVEPPEEPFIKDIVHGQLDADRMDYLLRDSLTTGSRYGDFDAEWILNVLALGVLRSGEKQVRKLCLDKTKGTGAIERMLHARLLMTQYVYGHKTTRAYEAEMINTLRLAADLVNELPDDTPLPIRTALMKRGQVETKEYLLLDDEVLWWALRRWAVWNSPLQNSGDGRREALSRHALRLVRRHKPWKTVRLTNSRMLRQATTLYKKITTDPENPLRFECYLDTMGTWPYKDPAEAARGGMDPEEAYFEDIHVLTEGGSATPIQEALGKSKMLEAMSVKWEERRFHYDREFETQFSGLFTQFGVY